MTNSRILVTGGTVLLGPASTGHFAVADVLVEDGRIAKIEAGLDAPDAALLDATGTFVLPGFVDTHAHLWEASMRGISADWDIIDFAWAIRYNHVGLHQPEDLYAGAYAGALASLDSGTTTVLDHAHALASPEHADEALRAVTDAGIRAVWAYGLSAVPGGSDTFTSPTQRQADARRLRTAVGDFGLVRMGLAANDLLSVPWAQTSSELALARDLDVVLTAHANTTWGPGRPAEIELLAHDGLLDARQIFSHADTSSDHELELLAHAGAALVSTPESELQMGLGMPLFHRAAALGVRVGLGSDLQANNSPDAFAQMRLARQAENGHRNQAVLDGAGLVGLAGAPVGVRDVLHAATMGGAEVLGLDGDIGSLEPGKAADIVLLRNDSIRQRPVVDPFATVVEHSQVGDVDTVLVDGRIVKRAGVLAGSRGETAVNLVEAAWSRLAGEMAARGGLRPPRPDGLFEQLSASVLANLPPWATA